MRGSHRSTAMPSVGATWIGLSLLVLRYVKGSAMKSVGGSTGFAGGVLYYRAGHAPPLTSETTLLLEVSVVNGSLQ